MGALLVGLPGGAAARRPTIPVTTTSDGVPGSLRSAIDTANVNGSPDTIVLRRGATYDLTVCGGPGEGDTNAHGDLDHRAPEGLRIIGAATIRNTCPAERLLEVLPGAGPLHLRSVTLIGGASNGPGGAIQTYDTPVTLIGGAVMGNSAADSGGGLSTVNGDVTIIGSTFARNAAGSEGGAIRSEGRVVIRNSTFSGNSAVASGGMMVTDGPTMLKNATVVDNTAPTGTGGGIRVLPSAAVTLSNTLLSGNGSENCDADGGTITSLGHSISSDASCNLHGPGDQPSTDPMVGSLSDNGGPTETHSLMPGSPAIGKGSPAIAGKRGYACEPVDQRAAPRRNCDVGAYELVRCGGVIVNVVGSNFGDVLRGTAAADGILGLDGKDTLLGKGGKDGLCGGAGKDKLKAGGGKDVCIGQGGRDKAKACEKEKGVPWRA